ncbi:MAG TPA: hypothetical protein VMT88_09605, partial [Actinomycetes bacterium]|nr:hypothetical protein [Actinomycetes bacterium]
SAVGVLFTGGASAGVDVTPPDLVVPAHASVPVGSQVPSTDWPGAIPVHFSWQASDPSGICHSSVIQYWGIAGDPVSKIWTGNDSQVDLDIVQWNGSLSDGVEGHAISVKDCAGNRSIQPISAIPLLFNEQGHAEAIVNEYSPNVYWRGQWQLRDDSTEAYGGGLATTHDAGASVTYAFDWSQAGLEMGSHVGIVMPMGPHRGTVKVSVGANQVATLDTYAPIARSRVIMTDIEVTDTSSPYFVLTLENVGQGVKSKVSIDEFIVL